MIAQKKKEEDTVKSLLRTTFRYLKKALKKLLFKTNRKAQSRSLKERLFYVLVCLKALKKGCII